MHKINPLSVEELVAYMFDNQQGGSVEQFQNDFSETVLLICELTKKCYVGFLQFENHKEPDEQFLYLSAHVYTLVESLYTSVKLLVHGFLAPSGNQFRVALEAMTLSVLLSWRGDLLLEKKSNRLVMRNFYEDFLKEERWTRSHLAIKILDKNRDKLGLSTDAMSLLNAAKDLYNSYSHVSLLSISAGIVSLDRVLFGGGYEHEQKLLFEKELHIRKQFIEKVPSFLESLYKRFS